MFIYSSAHITLGQYWLHERFISHVQYEVLPKYASGISLTGCNFCNPSFETPVNFIILKLCKLLQMGLGTNPHGTPLIFAVKRVLPSAQDPAYVYYSNVLSAFGLRVGGRGSEYKAIDHTAADVPRPPAAPALDFEAVLTREESANMCAVIRAVAAHQPEA